MFQSHILQERHKIVVELWDSLSNNLPGSHPAGFGDWLVSFYDQLERILSQSVKVLFFFPSLHILSLSLILSFPFFLFRSLMR